MAGKLRIALAGNANVGKSVIFNQLTGLHQHIGNWPGKTVEKAEGTLHFGGYEVDVVDLPGIYSLSAFSLEEEISRGYIATERPDLVVNVVDASILERNLFFTLQLIELERPMIVALNQVDVAERKGIRVDHERLSRILGVPVVPTVAVRGLGVYRLLEVALEAIEKRDAIPNRIPYGREVEESIEKVAELVKGIDSKYPARYVAIKLLEGDREVEEEVKKARPEALTAVREIAEEIERIHGHPCPTVITAERYNAAARIAREAQRIAPATRPPIGQRLHELTTHRILGYPVLAAVVLAVFYAIFTLGGYASMLLSDVLYGIEPAFRLLLGKGALQDLIWSGVVEGVIAGVTVALPYIAPFYFLLYLLEDSGYLSRVAFLMDVAMHKMGLHGKAFIPVMLGYGCNVPACLGCRIMETQRERFLAAFAVTLIPCAATTVVVLGLVGRYVGFRWVLALYVLDLAIVFLLGRLAFKTLPGEPTELIMEMHEYRLPHLETVAKQTWFRLEEFIRIAFPLIVATTFAVKVFEALGFLEAVSAAMIPVTVGWLGLRPEMGISLLYGVLRKELTLIVLTALLGTSNLGAVLTPLQMVVFSLVIMLYVPCVATIAACAKEFGWRKAAAIAVFEVAFAIFIGGVAARALTALGVLA
jgi:ferrous iron transport protein B